MKTKTGLLILVCILAMANVNAQDNTGADSELLGLPGDNLDLYATLDLFQKSKTIEAFEASLNDEETGVNNLDLNVDGNVDFIKVVTQKEGDDFAFVLQVDILENETQDVAVILVSKDSDDKVTIQMVGDVDLYGDDYVIEPKLETPAVTANPAYSGTDTVVVESEPATVVVVESEPIVHYVYSPAYVPYYPPYYYGYYPPYYRPYPIISINIYFGRHRHYHNRYYGGHRGGNTVIINNNNTYNNYNKTRKTSNTVNKNRAEGKYKRDGAANRPSKDAKPNTDKQKPQPKGNSGIKENKNSAPSTKPSTNPVAKPATKPAAKPAAKPTTKPSAKPSSRPAGKPKGKRKR